MATVNIYVKRNGQSNNIRVRDSEGHNPGNDDVTTDVEPSDTVVWQLDSNSGLYSLNGVSRKASSTTNLFSSGPSEQKVDGVPTGKYEGTISSDVSLRGKQESYYIEYKITQDGTVLHDDPKIKMSPTT